MNGDTRYSPEEMARNRKAEIDRVANQQQAPANVPQDVWDGMTESDRYRWAESNESEAPVPGANIPSDRNATALRGVVDRAITNLRAQTSALHDLQDHHDRGGTVSRKHLDALKGNIDAIVMELASAAGIN